MRSFRRLVFGIPADETRFERRGFRGGAPEVRRRLDRIGTAFAAGYHAALDLGRPDRLHHSLESVEPEMAGFAYEGAAMGFALLDGLTPWGRGRWRALLEGSGAPHAYMIHVGAGWAAARLGGRVARYMADEDPVLQWLVVDGLGFHDGYFHWPRTVESMRRPERLSGYARRAYDQGLGRSLWFVEGAEPRRIAATIARFDDARRADLWAGVGLASAYAGGVARAELEQLRSEANGHLPEVSQGVAFAAQARARAGNPAAHTELACEVLCGMSARDAAGITEIARQNLNDADGVPAYEVWRRRIQARLADEAAVAHG